MASSRVVILPDQNVTFQDFHSTRSFPSCSASCLLVPPCKCHTFLTAKLILTPNIQGRSCSLSPTGPTMGSEKPLGSRSWKAWVFTNGEPTNWHTHKLTQGGSVLLSGITFFLKGCSLLGSTAILKLLFEDDGCCQWAAVTVIGYGKRIEIGKQQILSPCYKAYHINTWAS